MEKKLLQFIFSFLLLVIVGTTTQAQDTTIYKMVEKQPEPIGGLKAFYEYIEANLKYPEEARQLKLQGRVMVKFIVEPDGTLSNVEIAKGIGGGCDEEAIRLIRQAPKWAAGKNKGQLVRVEVIRPITFKLDF